MKVNERKKRKKNFINEREEGGGIFGYFILKPTFEIFLDKMVEKGDSRSNISPLSFSLSLPNIYSLWKTHIVVHDRINY